MNEPLLHQAFLAVLPTCLTLSGWRGRDGTALYDINSRVRAAWDIALQACKDHPTRPPTASGQLLAAAAVVASDPALNSVAGWYPSIVDLRRALGLPDQLENIARVETSPEEKA